MGDFTEELKGELRVVLNTHTKATKIQTEIWSYK